MIMFWCVLLGLRNVFQTQVVEKIKTHFMFSKVFF